MTERAELARRTLRVLQAGVVPSQAAIAGIAAIVTLLASDLLGSDSLAGVGGAAMTVGAGLWSVPLATRMRRRGRRSGLMVGATVGGVGATVAAVGGQFRVLWLLVAGLFLVGAGQATSLQARYVATDLVPPDRHGAAIAAVVWIGTLGAVLGPAVTPWQQDIAVRLGLAPLIGPLVVAAALFLTAATIVAVWLRPDPLAVIGAIDPDVALPNPLRRVASSARHIAGSRRALLGLASMTGSQAAMVGVMTMTPPHMRDHGEVRLSGLVIAIHILGMYGLSPVVGRVVDRLGAVPTIAAGAAILGVGTTLSVTAGYVTVLIFAGLFLLGLGWNLALIAGTSLLTASVDPGMRVEAQGTADLALFSMAAIAALGSGVVKQSAGFPVLAAIAASIAVGLLAWSLSAMVRRPPVSPA